MKPLRYATLGLLTGAFNIFAVQAIRPDPYQTVYLYLAYQLDIYANGHRDAAIANNCQGSLAGDTSAKTTCNLWEFLKYIQNDSAQPDASTVPSSSNPLSGLHWVDPVQAAGYINKITIGGQQYYADWNIDKIFRQGTIDPHVSVVLDIAGGVISAAVNTLGPGDSSEGLYDAQNAIVGLQQGFVDTYAPKLAVAWDQYWTNSPNPPLPLRQVQLTAVDGSKYNYIDLNNTLTETTSNPLPLFNQQWVQFLKDMSNADNLSKRGVRNAKRDSGLSSIDIYAVSRLQVVASKVHAAGRRQSC